MKYLALSVLLVTACGAIVPQTASRLAGISPVEADPAGFEVALAIPQGLDIRPNGARMTLRAERAGSGEISEATYVLARFGGPDAGVGLEPEAGGQIVTYRVAEADLAPLRVQQALIRAWEAENDAETAGSLSVSIDPCGVGDGPSLTAEGSVFLRTEMGGEFLPVVRKGPITAIMDAETLGGLPACTPTG